MSKRRETLDSDSDSEEVKSRTTQSASRAKPPTSTTSERPISNVPRRKQEEIYPASEVQRQVKQISLGSESAGSVAASSSKTVSGKPSNSAGESRVETRSVDYTRFIRNFALSSLRDVSAATAATEGASYKEVIFVDDDESDLRP
jgi:hypothetical protein